MIRILILGHSFSSRMENRIGTWADVRVVGIPGASIAQIDTLIAMSRTRFPNFRPHFVVLFLGDNQVLTWRGRRSLASEMARVCAHTLEETGAWDVWIGYLFARERSRWTPDPAVYNWRAGMVNARLSLEIEALGIPNLHVLRHRCAASTSVAQSRCRSRAYITHDGTHLSREGWRLSLLIYMRRQLSAAVRRLYHSNMIQRLPRSFH